MRASLARSIFSAWAICACELPGLAAISTSTEYCAGRTFIGASVAMKFLKTATCRRRTK